MALPRKLMLFAMAGAAGFVVDVGVLYLVKDFTGPYLGRLVSFAAAVLTTFLINRNLTFALQAEATARWHGFGSYFVAMLAGGLINYGLYAGLIAWVAVVTAQPVFGVAAGSIAGMCVNFILSDKWVFRGAPGGKDA